MLENIILTAGWLGGIVPRYEGEQENDKEVTEWFFSTGTLISHGQTKRYCK
jgi:hypothetical protein